MTDQPQIEYRLPDDYLRPGMLEIVRIATGGMPGKHVFLALIRSTPTPEHNATAIGLALATAVIQFAHTASKVSKMDRLELQNAVRAAFDKMLDGQADHEEIPLTPRGA